MYSIEDSYLVVGNIYIVRIPGDWSMVGWYESMYAVSKLEQ